MKGAFRFPLIKIEGGSSPDPAVYCPTEGFYDPDDPDSPVIWNPINPDDGWFLIAEFQTSALNFTPQISASQGNYSWLLGDGGILMNQKTVSYTYPSSDVKTVKTYAKGTTLITNFSVDGDVIVGIMDISHSVFETITSLSFSQNSLMTGIILPDAVGVITSVSIYNTGIEGVLDLSVISALGSNVNFALYGNTKITSILFAAATSGSISILNLYGCSLLAGIIDLSMFTTWGGTSAQLNLSANPNLTGVILPAYITGTFQQINFSQSGFTGVLDLSLFSSLNSSGCSIFFDRCPNLTGVTFASSITGMLSFLSGYSCNLTGTLDLSKFTAWTATATIQLHLNPNLTGVTFASSITGTFSTLSIYSTGITGTLDLSKFTAWTATATFNCYNNTAMTGITFPSTTITGFIRTMRLYGCTSLGYVDFSKLKTGVASLNWNFSNNGWSAAIVNQVLYVINSISASGFSSRVINIGGTNADPDTTSGGYDGVAARNALISKGFTVTIT